MQHCSAVDILGAPQTPPVRHVVDGSVGVPSLGDENSLVNDLTVDLGLPFEARQLVLRALDLDADDVAVHGGDVGARRSEAQAKLVAEQRVGGRSVQLDEAVPHGAADHGVMHLFNVAAVGRDKLQRGWPTAAAGAYGSIVYGQRSCRTLTNAHGVLLGLGGSNPCVNADALRATGPDAAAASATVEASGG